MSKQANLMFKVGLKDMISRHRTLVHKRN